MEEFFHLSLGNEIILYSFKNFSEKYIWVQISALSNIVYHCVFRQIFHQSKPQFPYGGNNNSRFTNVYS